MEARKNGSIDEISILGTRYSRLDSTRLAFSSFREKENRIARVPTDTSFRFLRAGLLPSKRGLPLRSVSNDYYVEARIAFNYARRGRVKMQRARGAGGEEEEGEEGGCVCDCFFSRAKRRELFVGGVAFRGEMDAGQRLERTTVKSILRTGFDPASALPYRFLGSREDRSRQRAARRVDGREKRGDRIFAGR